MAILLLLARALHATTPLFTDTDLQFSSRMCGPIYLLTFGLGFVLSIYTSCLQVKMLCSSGGHFTRVPGGWEYQGGETRLVSASNYCHMQELQDALHRVSQTMRLDLSSSSGLVQCPSTVLLISCYLGQAMCAITVCQHTGHMHLAADFGFLCLWSYYCCASSHI